MSLMWMFYIADVVGSLKFVVNLISGLAIFIIAAITFCVICECGTKEEFNNLKRGIKIVLIPIVFIFITAFIPSKQTIYTMAATYGVQEAVANPDVQRVAGKSLAVIEKTLDSYLKEGKSNEHSSE